MRHCLMSRQRRYPVYPRRLLSGSSKSTKPGSSGDIPKDPSTSQLRAAFVCSAVPFVGFGIMDNAIMIVSGDYIDHTLGVREWAALCLF